MKFPTITVFKHISSFGSHNACITKLGTLILGANKFIIFISYCWINPSIRNIFYFSVFLWRMLCQTYAPFLERIFYFLIFLYFWEFNTCIQWNVILTAHIHTLTCLIFSWHITLLICYLFYNPLNLVSVAHRCMCVGPFLEAQEIYYRLSPLKGYVLWKHFDNRTN